MVENSRKLVEKEKPLSIKNPQTTFRIRERSPEGNSSLRWEGFVEKVRLSEGVMDDADAENKDDEVTCAKQTNQKKVMWMRLVKLISKLF